jgi:hypothetical protein
MDSQNKFRLEPLSLEKEFLVLSTRDRLHELSREELEKFLIESLTLMVKLANQLNQLKDYVFDLEGKTPQSDSNP